MSVVNVRQGARGACSRARALSQKPLLRNSLWMFSGQGLSLVAQAGYFVVIARLLGSVQYGLLAGAAASVSVLSQYGAFGSGLIFLRYVSPDHGRFRDYWMALLFRASASFFCS